MSVVYLSGPISLGGSCSDVEIATFTAIFATEARRIRALGHEVINPCEVPTQPSWEEYMRYGMKAVAECDTVGVLPRWAESRGSALEVFVATQLRIPVVPAHEIGEANA